MFSLAAPRSPASERRWQASAFTGGDGETGDRNPRDGARRRKEPPAAGLFGERTRSDALPFIKAPPKPSGDAKGGGESEP